ncbi:MAG: OmpA family protein [Paludibacteraceae bacterium]
MKKNILLLTMVLGIGNYAWAQFNTTTAGNISSYGEPEAIEQNDTAVVASENDSVDAAIVENLLPDTIVTTVIDSVSVQSDTIINAETNDTTILNVQQTVTEEEIVVTPAKKDKKEKVEKPKYGIKCNHWSIAGHVGVAFLDGDQHQNYNDMWPRSKVDCSFDFMVEYTVNPGFGIFLEYAYNPYNGYANYYFQGQKDPTTGLQRNLSIPFDFDGLSHEITAGFSLNLLNMFYANRRQTWGLYLNAGAGFAFYDVNAYDRGTQDVIDREIDGVRVAPSITKGRAVTFPIGAMVEYNPLRWLAIALNIEYRLHAKDNLDATEKGNANDNTIYMSLGLRWKINNPKHKEYPHVRNLSPRDFSTASAGGACCDQVAANTKKIAELEQLISQMTPCNNDSADHVVQIIEEIEPDDDHDGVPNSRDREPNTPEGSFVNTWGQALDQQAIERILGYGQYKGEIPAIYFETGKSKMSLQAQMELAKIARKLYADPTLKVDVIGYCDNVGSDELNATLSVKRAEEAKNQLIRRYGINADRIAIYGKGKVPGPVDDFEPNRRCDFIMYTDKDKPDTTSNQ